MDSKDYFIGFVALIAGLCGVLIGLSIPNLVAMSEDEIEVCCSLDGEDDHRNPHPLKVSYGIMTRLSVKGVEFFHYKVGIDGVETHCGGHEKKLDKGLPCDNLNTK